jgi:predicted TIM-barrel fold metal-dependent hydrolase
MNTMSVSPGIPTGRDEPIIIVSTDSHAGVPRELWSEYLDPSYHHLLAGLEDDHKQFASATRLFSDYSPETLAVLDPDGIIASGGMDGVRNRQRRLEEMDREGIAAEVVYFGDQHTLAMFHSSSNRPCRPEVRDAGVRAYHRWASEQLKDAQGRILLVGVTGSCANMDATVRELEWIAAHGFVGTMVPGHTADDAMPPLQDPYYEPFWAACDRLGLALAVHAGHGHAQGAMAAVYKRLNKLAASGGSEAALNDMVNNAEESFFARDVRPRQAMWQVMLSGAFDRYPHLRLMVTEVRADWVPGTLRRLDEWFDRGATPMKQRPTDYWAMNCRAGVSSIHRAEVEMRHQIGVGQMMFGRDYPHGEGTWPATIDWIRDAFRGVPIDEVRLILGENAISTLGLDRENLSVIARQIGPNLRPGDQDDSSLDPRLTAIFHRRGGYLKPAEQVDVDEIDRLFGHDCDVRRSAS